jgi:hypothetical protein
MGRLARRRFGLCCWYVPVGLFTLPRHSAVPLPPPPQPDWAVPHTHLALRSRTSGLAGGALAGTRHTHSGTITPPSNAASRAMAPPCAPGGSVETLRCAAPVSTTVLRADGNRRLPEQEYDVNFLASDSPKCPIGIDNKLVRIDNKWEAVVNVSHDVRGDCNGLVGIDWGSAEGGNRDLSPGPPTPSRKKMTPTPLSPRRLPASLPLC